MRGAVSTVGSVPGGVASGRTVVREPHILFYPTQLRAAKGKGKHSGGVIYILGDNLVFVGIGHSPPPPPPKQCYGEKTSLIGLST